MYVCMYTNVCVCMYVCKNCVLCLMAVLMSWQAYGAFPGSELMSISWFAFNLGFVIISISACFGTASGFGAICLALKQHTPFFLQQNMAVAIPITRQTTDIIITGIKKAGNLFPPCEYEILMPSRLRGIPDSPSPPWIPLSTTISSPQFAPFQPLLQLHVA